VLGVQPAVWGREALDVHTFLRSCRRGEYDACVILDEPAAVYMKSIPRSLPVIKVRHNVFGHAGRWPRGPATGSSRSGSSLSSILLRNRYHQWLARRFNRWTARSADVVLAGTTAAVETLQRLAPRTAVVLLPTMGMLSSGMLSSTGAADQGRPIRTGLGRLVAVFVGNCTYPPNAEGVQWFASEVVPRLSPAARAGFLFRFVGQPPPRSVTDPLASELGVEFTGFVRDLPRALLEADVGIIPLLSGDGVKVKSVTMLAAGLPTVSTRVGVEGLPPRGYLLADAPAEFAAALEQLRDPGLRARLSQEATGAMRDYARTGNPEQVLGRAIELAVERRRSRTSRSQASIR
jgi:hypothetical protein